jgi:hypothetical protein
MNALGYESEMCTGMWGQIDGDDFAMFIPTDELFQINRVVRCEDEIGGGKDLWNVAIISMSSVSLYIFFVDDR